MKDYKKYISRLTKAFLVKMISFMFGGKKTEKKCIFFYCSQKNVKIKKNHIIKISLGQSRDITFFNLHIKFGHIIFKIVAVFCSPVNPIWRLFFLVSIANAC